MWYTLRHGEDSAHTLRRGGLRADQEKERLVRRPHREDTRFGKHRLRGVPQAAPGIYCLIDEYDNFTNTILAESDEGAYNALCHDDGFFKQFFTELKALTTSLDAPLKRLFITGVSPVTMDDVTSGFNIGTGTTNGPSVELHRLVLVFHGGDCVLAEAV